MLTLPTFSLTCQTTFVRSVSGKTNPSQPSDREHAILRQRHGLLGEVHRRASRWSKPSAVHINRNPR